MSEENLGDALNTEYATHQKDIAIKTLGSRTHLSIAKIAKLLEHKEHGATIGSITLDELLVAAGASTGAPAPKAAKAAKAAAAPKAAKAPKAPKAAKAAKTNGAPKAKKAVKAKSNGSPKAGNGSPKAGKGSKPRLVRDVAYKEVKAALKANKGDCSNGDLVKATDYTAVQIRTFLNEMIETGDVKYTGKGRGTKYSLA